MRKSDRSAFAAFLIGCVLAFGIILGAKEIDKVNQQQVACQQVNTLRGALDTILQNGEKALPHSSFFKGHPTQLAEAQREYQTDIDKLKPLSC